MVPLARWLVVPLAAVADGGVRESDGGCFVPWTSKPLLKHSHSLHSKLRDEYGHQAREHVLCHWTGTLGAVADLFEMLLAKGDSPHLTAICYP